MPKFLGPPLLTLGAVNPNYLTNVQDFSLLINATTLLRQIASTQAAKSLYSVELLPGSTVQTENDFGTFVTNSYGPVFHPIGTAPMLPRSLGGVVDSNLRVYGVQGVRVVGELFISGYYHHDGVLTIIFSATDASVIPLQLSAHLSSTVYGIAEKVCLVPIQISYSDLIHSF